MSKNLLFLFLIIFSKEVLAQTVTDIDGNTYNTVNIGSQTWMKENLKTTHFSNGVLIPTTTAAVMVDSTSLFQWSYNDDSTNINTYGRLYTWFTVSTNNNNVCPTGWRVPNNTDWSILSTFLGGDSIAGSKMKDTGTTYWSSTDSSVTNSSLFTGLPGGFRGNPSGFLNIGNTGCFWSSTPMGSSSFQRGFSYKLYSIGGPFSNTFIQSVAVANCGMSVRCIKNTTTTIQNVDTEQEMQLFPNPFVSDITLNFKTASVRNLYIYSIEGELLVQKELSVKNITLELPTLQKGIYLLKVVGDDSEFVRKIIKK